MCLLLEKVGREIRLAAAIAFKNIAKTYWEPVNTETP
jgi:hypothetical protein